MNTASFFRLIFSQTSGLIEVRALSPAWVSARSNYVRYCEAPEKAAQVSIEMTECEEPLDVYYGVCPRTNAGSTREFVEQAGCVWADIDAKDFGGSKLDAYKRVWGEVDKPSILVDTGHGYHAYWMLRSPCTDLNRIERINTGLAEALGGDKKTFNVNRLLRVPGTTNVKAQGASTACNIVQYSGFTYDVDYFRDDSASSQPTGTFTRSWRDYLFPLEVSTYPPLCTLDQRWQALIAQGIVADKEGKYTNGQGKPDRSALDFAGCLRLFSSGYTVQQVVSVFMDPLNGIGEKVREFRDKRAQQTYLCMTIGRARELYASRDRLPVSEDDKGVRA